MSLKKIAILWCSLAVFLIIGKQLFVQYLLQSGFDLFSISATIIQVVLMLSIPIYFVYKNQLGKEKLVVSITHTLAFVLVIFLVYLVLFFTRVIIMIDLFAQKPMYLVVEFVMMVSILIALCLPFMIRLKKAELAQQA